MRGANCGSPGAAHSLVSSSPIDDCGGPHTAAEELAAQIVDCTTLLPCINVEASVGSIEPLSPGGRTLRASLSWRSGADEVRSLEVHFSYADAFTCRTASGNVRAYESLMALLVENGCGRAEKKNM